jgi:hypothetical protein
MVEQFARGTQQASLSPAAQEAPTHQRPAVKLFVLPLFPSSHNVFMVPLEQASRAAQQVALSTLYLHVFPTH